MTESDRGAPPVVAALLFFAALYLAALAAGVTLRLPHMQWTALAAAVVATTATITLWEGGRWQLGFGGRPLRELALGVLFAVTLVGTAGILIVAATPLRYTRGDGFPFRDLITVFLPAAIHEELLFRGYPFQKLWRRSRWFATVFVSLLFAALHIFNDSVTALALVNVFLGGVVLSLAYGVYERLWLPIALHLAWNVMSGPILGYRVSGWAPAATLFRLAGEGPLLLTGGGFGIEGSVLMTAIELLGAAFLWRWNRMRRRTEAE